MYLPVKPVEVTVTCGSADEAHRIMKAMVERRLAACGQTWPIRSCYRWAGKVVTDEEHVLLLKSVDSHFAAVCDLIRSMHTYDLPSIVMIPLEGHGPGYLEWLLEATECRLQESAPGVDPRRKDSIRADSGQPSDVGARAGPVDQTSRSR